MVIVIPLDPKTKKTGQRIVTNGNRKMIIPSKQYMEYEQACGWYVKPRSEIDYPVNVKCIFYRQKKTRVDLPNLLQAVDDILVKYGVLKDDNYKIIAGHDGSRIRFDKDNPRTEITIEKVDEDF